MQQVVPSHAAPLAMILLRLFPLLLLKFMKWMTMSSSSASVDPRSFLKLNHLQLFAPSTLLEQYTVGNCFASFLTLTQVHPVASSSICLLRKLSNRPCCCYSVTTTEKLSIAFYSMPNVTWWCEVSLGIIANISTTNGTHWELHIWTCCSTTADTSRWSKTGVGSVRKPQSDMEICVNFFD
jgi:hypothetical protein